MLLHAGDHYRDAAHLARLLAVPVHAVVGNCDPRTDGPGEKLLAVEGVTILLTHGHLYDAHYSPLKLFYRARELQAGLVVYGHTHIPYDGECERIRLFNPGSVHHPRGGAGPGYGLLEIEGGRIVGGRLCALRA